MSIKKAEPLKDASGACPVERRDRHAERPGFRMNEIQISPSESVPWHYHNIIQDAFYVLEGRIKIYLMEPKENVTLNPGDIYAVKAPRPHLVTNDGDVSATFLVLQGVGEYDYVPLVDLPEGS